MRLVVALVMSLALTGCTIAATSSPSVETGLAITGKVHGGQQPIVGAHVYLMAANATGYGGSGIAASTSNASISLLTGLNGHLDSIGYFVPTAADGSFSITGDYACTAGQQVYLYVLGGNPGAGTNTAAGLMAILGNCPSTGNFATQTPYVWVNEVSTVAAAYAMAGFATDAIHVSSSGSALAKTGIANAFANAANLASLSTGVALTITPSGNGGVPQTTIDTLANILAACVNSTGPTSATCATLFADAESAGSSGIKPTDTASAAINIAHNPGVNVAALYALPAPAAAFAPALSAQPNDFTLGINFTGGGLNAPTSIAIDASGDAWIANYTDYGQGSVTGSISKFSSLGAPISPTDGYTGGGLDEPEGIVVDGSGNVWAANFLGDSVSRFSSAGTALSPSSGYTGGGLSSASSAPRRMAIDAAGNAWVPFSNGVAKLSSVGTAISPASGFLPGGGYGLVAIDGSGDVWLGLVKISSAGSLLSPSTGYSAPSLGGAGSMTIDSSGNLWFTLYSAGYPPYSDIGTLSNAGTVISPYYGYTGGGLSDPAQIAVDGQGNLWIANAYNRVSEFTNGGTAVSPSTGYTGGTMNNPVSLALDGSGNAWVANLGNSITELIGIATPVITPICAGLPTSPTANGTSNLGTRP